MPRLLLLCEFPTLLGGERSMLATLEAVRAAGFEVVVAAPPVGPLAEELARRGVEAAPWQVRNSETRAPLDEVRRELAQLIRTCAPNLVHANSLSTSRISGPVLSELRIPSVGHLRDIVRLSRANIADLNCHTRLVAVSHATRDFHVAAGVDADRTVVIYNGVDTEMFRPRTVTGFLHRELNLGGSELLVGTIGQIIVRKGLDVLVAAAKRIATARTDAHFVVVGERTSGKLETHQLERDLQAATLEPPLRGRLHLLGSRSDVPAILNELTLLMHPARQEPLGRVLLEAAASGLAIIATDVGGTREIFPPGERAACLVPAGDAIALADAAIQLLDDPQTRQSLAVAARRRMVTAFSVTHAAERLIGEYLQNDRAAI